MLNRKKINTNTFNKILEIFKERIEEVSELGPYFYGYKDKKIIKYNPRTKVLICQARYINYAAGCQLILPEWKQIVVMSGTEIQVNETEDVMYARKADKIINTILLKYYKNEEIEDILNSHTIEKDSPIQRRLPAIYQKNVIHHFNNCVYYDINGAHRDALCELFPLAKKDFLKVNKKAANIYVGNLCHHNHRPTYYWIVHRTANILMTTISHIGGLVLYANTDGVIAYHPQNTINTSDKLGEFKKAMDTNDIYFYYSEDSYYTNYQSMQYKINGKKEIKGTLPIELRNEMNLSQGIVARYKQEKIDGIMKYKEVDLVKKEIIEYD